MIDKFKNQIAEFEATIEQVKSSVLLTRQWLETNRIGYLKSKYQEYVNSIQLDIPYSEEDKIMLQNLINDLKTKINEHPYYRDFHIYQVQLLKLLLHELIPNEYKKMQLIFSNPLNPQPKQTLSACKTSIKQLLTRSSPNNIFSYLKNKYPQLEEIRHANSINIDNYLEYMCNFNNYIQLVKSMKTTERRFDTDYIFNLLCDKYIYDLYLSSH